jgi:hypothetical protein
MRDRSSNLAHDPPEPEVARHSAPGAAVPATDPLGRAALFDLIERRQRTRRSRKRIDRRSGAIRTGIEDEPVNYRQRMLMNVISVAIVTVILGVGVWIANNLS